MKYEPITTPPLPLIENFAAPELFATGISGCGIVHNTVLLTLEKLRCDHTRHQPTLERVVTGRLTLSIAAAQAIVLGLNEFLSQHGLSPTQAVTQGATCQ